MIIVDTGPLVALADPRDPARGAVLRFLAESTRAVVFPSAIVGEVAYFIQRRAGDRTEAAFLRGLTTGRFAVEDPTRADYLRAADLVEQYANFPLGTVDALIVAMAERLKVTTLLTLDRRHFGSIQPLHCQAFEIAP